MITTLASISNMAYFSLKKTIQMNDTKLNRSKDFLVLFLKGIIMPLFTAQTLIHFAHST